MRKILITITALLSMLCMQAQETDLVEIEIKVDVNRDVHPISPYVYGANDANTISTAIRWGGNRTSAYNWETNASNAGKDYGPHNSDTHLGTEMQGPAAPILTMTQTAKTRGQYALVTLQAMGYVAADANGKVTEAAPSNRWNEVKFRKIDEDGNRLKLSLEPNKGDGVVYIEEELNFLIDTLEKVRMGGIDGFAIDNEPALWKSTHALAHPASVTKDELLRKTEEVASLVKEYAPQAEVYGPMFYGWWDANQGRDFGGYFVKGKEYKWFVDYYLDEIKTLEGKYGKRLVDVLAIHWYPEDKDKVNGNRIVDLDGKGYDLTTPEMITARLRAPRELWDYRVTPNSGAQPGTMSATSLPLLPRLKKSVEDYYPGTKIGFTEFKYDAEDHFSGGLALVDVLGVFGREGVYMACKWDPLDKKYALAAYNLYRNYDGKGGTFGETSVQAITTHNDTISTVASLDEFGNLHLIVVNKSKEAQEINYALSNGLFVSGKAFGFNAISEEIKELASIETIDNNNFTYTVSAYSATHFVLQAAEQTQLIHAIIPEDETDAILLTFDSEITIEETFATEQLNLQKENGEPITVLNVQKVEGKDNQLKVNVDYTFSSTDMLCTISYNESSIKGKSDYPIHNFFDVAIRNQLAVAPVVIYDATVNYNGKTVVVNTSKTINVDDLQITQNKEQLTSILVEQNPINEYQYLVSVKPRIVKFDTIVVKYNNSKTQAINKGPYYSPCFQTIELGDNFTIYAIANTALKEPDIENVKIKIKQDGEKELEISDVAYSKTSNQLTISFEKPLNAETNYEFYYEDNEALVSLVGGYMDDVNARAVENNLRSTPEIVQIINNTTKIEAEDYTYLKSKGAKLEICNDEGSGLHVGFVGRNNQFAYAIDVVEAGTYTFSMRHAGGNAGYVKIEVNDFVDTLYITPSGSYTTWVNSALPIELQKGKSMIIVEFLTATPNFNYFEIKKGAFPSPAKVLKVQFSKDKKIFLLPYDREISIFPQVSDLLVTVDDKVIDFTIDYYKETNKSMIALFFKEPISGEFKISYSETSGRTSNGGILLPYSYNTVITDINQTPETEIAIYPNPLKAGQKLTITGDATTTYLCTIRTITGAFVAQEQFVGATFVQNLPAGIYMITLSAENYNKTMKLLVQ